MYSKGRAAVRNHGAPYSLPDGVPFSLLKVTEIIDFSVPFSVASAAQMNE